MNTIKSGFLTIIGPPNAGKSTLLNALLNYDLNIISKKPQTTRNNIAGILTDKEKGIQLIITDTPGILKKNKSLLDQKLQDSIYHAITESDVILFLLSSSEEFSTYNTFLEKFKNEKKIILVLNKTDQLDRELTPDEKEFNLPFLKISAKEKNNLDELLNTIIPFLKENIQYYPDDVLSDRTERFFTKEYIREALLKNLKDEIPHQTFVDIEEMKDKEDIYYVYAMIYIERENHKKMVIGKNGSMIKKIGIQARGKIEKLLDKKVYLELKVKVKPKWREDPAFLKKLEYY